MTLKYSIHIALLAALLLGCQSCVETSNGLGGDFIPDNQKLDTYVAELPIEDISICMVDSLSGFSQKRVTIGALRDADFGLSTRSSAFTLVPLCNKLDFGTNPVVTDFYFAMGLDTVCVVNSSDKSMLQSVYVHELEAPLNPENDFDCNGKNIGVKPGIISRGTPVITGSDSLRFHFDPAYSQALVDKLNGTDMSDFKGYLNKFPGIMLSTDTPQKEGGRINLYDLQVGFDASSYGLTGNHAILNLRSTYDGKQIDTTFYFYYGATDYFAIDSLFQSAGTGSFPEYALNLTTHETASLCGDAGEWIPVEGGGGLKPKIKASTLKQMAREAISKALTESRGSDKLADRAVIARATVVLPFEFSADKASLLDYYPPLLSPTCRIHNNGGTMYAGLTDASNEKEDQGIINRDVLQYSPDITYHMQQLVTMDDSKVESGDYDVWFLIMANEVTTTTSGSSSSDDMSEYYQYLAYQSYYNSMYGGYGGYGGYGYGGYGYDSYSNYYSYMLASMYASQSNTTVSTAYELDHDRFYKAYLCGPASDGRKPTLKLVFAVPKE